MHTNEIVEVKGQRGSFSVRVGQDGQMPEGWPHSHHEARAVALAMRERFAPGTIGWMDGLDADGVILCDHGEDGVEVYVHDDVNGKPVRARQWMQAEDMHGETSDGGAALRAALTPILRAELGLPASA